MIDYAKRLQELRNAVSEEGENLVVLEPLLEHMVRLEIQLEQLICYPHYDIDPCNPKKQKVLPVAKLYKELLQQYINTVKAVQKSTDSEKQSESSSPLFDWLVNHKNVESR